MEIPRRIKYGLGTVSVRCYTRKQAQRVADKLAAQANKGPNQSSFWRGVVCSTLDDFYWRVSLAGMPEDNHG
jgi:hypothetical protein